MAKKYWYPVFSELRITYECPDLPFAEENLRDLTWALDWHFPIEAIGGEELIEVSEALFYRNSDFKLSKYTKKIFKHLFMLIIKMIHTKQMKI